MTLIILAQTAGATVDGISIPTVGVTGALLAMLGLLIRSWITRSDTESKAYRELLVNTLSSKLDQAIRAQGDSAVAMREQTVAMREQTAELHKLFVVTQRTERMLLKRGFPDPDDEKEG